MFFILLIQSKIRTCDTEQYGIYYRKFHCTNSRAPVVARKRGVYSLIKIEYSMHVRRDCKLNLYTRISSEIKIEIKTD